MPKEQPLQFYSSGKYVKVPKDSAAAAEAAAAASRGARCGAGAQWSVRDSKAAAARRLRGPGEEELQRQRRQQEEQLKAETLRKQTLEKRGARMSMRPWRDPPPLDPPDEQPLSLFNQEGKRIENPQAPPQKSFKPLQYSNAGCFDDLLRSGCKKGANFKTGTPRLLMEQKLAALEWEEREKSARRVYAGLDVAVVPPAPSSSHDSSAASPSPRRPYAAASSSSYVPVDPPMPSSLTISQSLSHKIGPTFGKGERLSSPLPGATNSNEGNSYSYDVDRDPRNISYSVLSSRSGAGSYWARSTSSKLGNPRSMRTA